MRIYSLLIVTLFFSFSLHCQKFIRVTKNNQVQTINLANDEVLEIKLPCNPSTGFGWYPTSINKDVITQTGDWVFLPEQNDGKVGQPGTEVIRFIGVSLGTSELTLEYKRPWEKNKSSVDNFKLILISNGKYTGNYSQQSTVNSQQRKVNSPQSSVAKGSSSLPPSFSWQAQCTPVKNQEHCGSCWAFASTSCFEAIINIIDNNVRSLSEQWLINCTTGSGNDGCQGGNCPNRYWVSPGAVYDSLLPYVDGLCNASDTAATCIGKCGTYTYHEKADKSGLVNRNSISVDKIKQAIYNYGPVWSAIAVGNNFHSYSNGIFINADTAASLNHSVAIVGWKDSTLSNGISGYWIIRNSWGAGWGEHGYMRIGYGVSAVGASADYIIYKGGITPCSGIPNPGNTLTSANPVCSSVAYTLSLQNYTSGNGVTYQWQSSADDSIWSNVISTADSLYVSSQTDTTWYRCEVTCSGDITTSNPLKEMVINTPAPAVISQVTYCQDDTASSLTASGSNLLWYTSTTGGTGDTVAPTPLTTKADTISYYVSQTINGCESTRAKITVIVYPLPATPAIAQNGSDLVSNTVNGNQWYAQNGIITGATSPSFTPVQNGLYYVIVIKNGCQSDSSNVIDYLSTGTENLNKVQYFNIYPNPVTNELIVEVLTFSPSPNGEGRGEVFNINLTNIVGQSMFSCILNKKSVIDMSNLPYGMYIIKIFNEKEIFVRKIMKE